MIWQIRSTKDLTIDGKTIAADEVIATIESDHDAERVINGLRTGAAVLAPAEASAATDEAPTESPAAAEATTPTDAKSPAKPPKYRSPATPDASATTEPPPQK